MNKRLAFMAAAILSERGPMLPKSFRSSPAHRSGPGSLEWKSPGLGTSFTRMVMPNPTRAVMIAFTGVLVLLAAQDQAMTQAEGLKLEAKIPIGNVSGRIDHMAVDLARQRLFIAELGNNTVGIVDLNSRNVIRTMTGLKEPQGVAYLPSMDTLYIANGGDGSVRQFRGADYAAAGQIDLGDDADNIRLDIPGNRIIVGYGSGGLAMIDAASSRKIADIPLSVHPEGFQLDPGSGRIFVNLPRSQAIAVVDGQSGKQTATWPTKIAGGNFPMALEQDARHALVAFRNPARLGAFSMDDGSVIASPEICGDADDLFVDPKRRRVYISCGEGFLDVLDPAQGAYRRVARIATVAGARTSLFVPEMDRLMLAVPASGREAAAIWVYQPAP
jgi:DNA-binding beta-propeller fold protein YncE